MLFCRSLAYQHLQHFVAVDRCNHFRLCQNSQFWPIQHFLDSKLLSRTNHLDCFDWKCDQNSIFIGSLMWLVNFIGLIKWSHPILNVLLITTPQKFSFGHRFTLEIRHKNFQDNAKRRNGVIELFYNTSSASITLFSITAFLTHTSWDCYVIYVWPDLKLENF